MEGGVRKMSRNEKLDLDKKLLDLGDKNETEMVRSNNNHTTHTLIPIISMHLLERMPISSLI